MALELGADQGVVALEELAPAPVPQLGGCSVDSTMSVNSTVSSLRSGSGAWRVPVRNDSTSSRSRIDVAGEREVVLARKLDESRTGMLSATKRAPSTGHRKSPLRWSTRVGAEIAGSTSRMSISAASRTTAFAIAGLAATRW